MSKLNEAKELVDNLVQYSSNVIISSVFYCCNHTLSSYLTHIHVSAGGCVETKRSEGTRGQPEAQGRQAEPRSGREADGGR